MREKDLRPEQVKLLRFEKIIKEVCKNKVANGILDKAPVLAGLGLVTAAAAGSAAKLGTDKPLQFAADITAAATAGGSSDAWLTNLAEVVTKSHNAIETLAEQGSYLLLQASGGTPKDPPSEAVASLLSTGLF